MERPRTHQRGFLKGTKVLAASLSSILSASIAVIGSTLFLAPSFVVENMFACLEEGDDMTELEVLLSRIIGGLFVALAITSALLLLPMCSCRRQDSSNSAVDKCRTSLTCQAIVGLTLVIVGLWNEMRGSDTDCRAGQYGGLLGGGAAFLVLSSLGLMASFWPSDENDHQGRETARRWCCRRTAHVQSFNSQLSEPLLSADAEAPAPESRADDTESEALTTGEEDHTGMTSRIRGTRRLIKLAAPQVSYLYIGCAVLLVRLPFSLSIPHFISTTLGALSRGDYHSARIEILLLFTLGTIDAALDFWCVFFFGYAKERIVRGVRIDTFASMLRQEVTFFDRHTSGELSSRLSSDCGEMAGGKLWSIFSIFTMSLVLPYIHVLS